MKRQRSLLEFLPKERAAAPAVAAALESEYHDRDGSPPLALATSKATLARAVSGDSARVAASQADAKKKIGGGAASFSPTSLRSSDTPRRTQLAARHPQAAVQTSLDFGQRNAGGVMTCGLCGMLFNFTATEDIRLHERCCTALSSGNSGASKTGRLRADDRDAWLASAQLGKALEGLALPKRRGQAVRESTRRCTAGEVCAMVHESSGKELVLYVFDGSKQDCVKDAVFRRLVEALEFSEVMLCAAAYSLVTVVHGHTGRLLCAVAGRPSTREQDPVLMLGKSEGCAATRCYTRSCATFCDVPYIWCQCDAALEAMEADWWHTKTMAALQPARLAVQDFFRCTKRLEPKRQRLHALVDTALRSALKTLGRHVSYGHTLCPRSGFSYDRNVVSSDVMRRVDAVTECSDAAAPLYTHADDHDALVDSEAELSVVSYDE
ncbi:uncharacterized protein Tco025E_03238 [Trypanosoma conorhini]|uniref:N-acetyltransferase ESCO zinc-finger domain-containing protein n=1 Tax=Trypanosoma conorhini TaxID=83891 RepID=A0A422PW36_9TRYP|nr:uncharacterized protein Tco025E_03238 [Trypanosoma conorhini]RNF21908.1 hypothetical protein Tco025E_03238 [Trypanosoma conorhini]